MLLASLLAACSVMFSVSTVVADEALDRHAADHNANPIPPISGQGPKGQSCAGKMVLSHHVKPGTINQVAVYIPLRFAGQVEAVVVDAPGQRGPAIFQADLGSYVVYRYDWTVPELSAEATVSFSGLKENKLVCAGAATYYPLLDLELSVTGPSHLKVAEEGGFSATVRYGTPPYAVTWNLAGEHRRDSIQYTFEDSWQRKAFSTEGWKIVTAIATDQDGRSGSGSAKVRVYEEPVKVTISGPSSLEVGQTASWFAQATGGKPPYRYSYRWSDDAVAKKGGASVRSFSEAKTYHLQMDAIDEDLLIGYAWLAVEVKQSAQSPFEGTLAGQWSGTCYGGTVSGTFEFTIVPGGNIAGFYAGDDEGPISGRVTSSGEFSAAAGAAGECAWAGQIGASGDPPILFGQGTWSCGEDCAGTWR